MTQKGHANRASVKDYADLAGYWREVKTEPNRKEYLYKKPLDLPRSMILQHATITHQTESLIQYHLYKFMLNLEGHLLKT